MTSCRWSSSELMCFIVYCPIKSDDVSFRYSIKNTRKCFSKHSLSQNEHVTILLYICTRFILNTYSDIYFRHILDFSSYIIGCFRFNSLMKHLKLQTQIMNFYALLQKNLLLYTMYFNLIKVYCICCVKFNLHKLSSNSRRTVYCCIVSVKRSAVAGTKVVFVFSKIEYVFFRYCYSHVRILGIQPYRMRRF